MDHLWQLAALILEVSVGAESGIIGEIPADVIRIFIDHHPVAAPVPVCDYVVIVRRDVPVIVIEPEALTISSAEHEDMLPPESAVKAAPRPRLIDAIVRVT